MLPFDVLGLHLVQLVAAIGGFPATLHLSCLPPYFDLRRAVEFGRLRVVPFLERLLALRHQRPVIDTFRAAGLCEGLVDRVGPQLPHRHHFHPRRRQVHRKPRAIRQLNLAFLRWGAGMREVSYLQMLIRPMVNGGLQR